MLIPFFTLQTCNHVTKLTLQHTISTITNTDDDQRLVLTPMERIERAHQYVKWVNGGIADTSGSGSGGNGGK